MNNQLKTDLRKYKVQAKCIGKGNFDLNKFGLASTAILASMISAPVELSSQVVCGNQGAPTRTVGPCVGDIGFLNSYDCAFFDFDGDGNNELQIYYYNFSGQGSAAYAVVDPINNDLAYFGKGANTQTNSGGAFVFPGNPLAQTFTYRYLYEDFIHVLPLTGGGGYGFITFDADAHPAGTNHPTTGMPICCYHSALPQMWGAQTGVNMLSDITIQTNALSECPAFSSLPVELSRFEAKAAEKSIVLKWRTESEANNAGFEIERSMDGEKYEAIKFVEGKGNSNNPEKYSFHDANVQASTRYYYRLKQIDFDGSFAYSHIRSASTKEEGMKTKVFPNPAKGFVRIILDGQSEGVVNVGVYSSTGELIMTQKFVKENRRSQYKLDMKDFVSGIYYLKIENNGGVKYEKLMVEK